MNLVLQQRSKDDEFVELFRIPNCFQSYRYQVGTRDQSRTSVDWKVNRERYWSLSLVTATWNLSPESETDGRVLDGSSYNLYDCTRLLKGGTLRDFKWRDGPLRQYLEDGCNRKWHLQLKILRLLECCNCTYTQKTLTKDEFHPL